MRTLRRALAALLVLAALTAFFYWQNCSIQTEQVEVALSALPPQFDGLRVAEIADLHGRQFGTDNAALLRAVKNADPDLICIDGDLFDENTDLSMLPPLLRGLVAIAPTFYVTGNHEFQVARRGEMFDLMERLGVCVLRDDYTVLTRDGASIVIAGVDDPCGPLERKTPAELVAQIRAEVGQDAFILLLAHRNDPPEQWAALGVPLVLAGHCHGGVVRLPLVGGVFGTERTLFPAYDAGLYRADGTALYVSRGMGYSRAHFRLFNRPHLPVLVLRSVPET